MGQSDPLLKGMPTAEAILNELEDRNDDQPMKKNKKNPCRVCLNILEDSSIKRICESINISNVNEYHYSNFVIHTSFPKSVIIRNHSMCIYLKEKFPGMYNSDGLDNINKIFKIVSAEVISQVISKSFHPQSNLVLSVEISYEDDNLETENVKQLNYLIRKGKQQETSKNVIMEVLNSCNDILFKKHFPVPPNIPNKQPSGTINCIAESIWIGGRYLKFSREMGQTPWIINNKVMTTYNLQEIIFNSIKKILGYSKNKLTFCASGREDSDVCMLGNGRPFYIQIDDPKYASITFNQFRAVENEVLCSKLAAIVKLQNISKCNLKKIKDGEQTKRKHYYALCQLGAVNTNYVVNTINIYGNKTLEISQKTPLRVLHRRTQATRRKNIYSMDAKICPGHSDLIEVKLVTQAGTYIKEFVNGDFQRTQPNLESMLQCPIDVVALDVINIDLAWPE